MFRWVRVAVVVVAIVLTACGRQITGLGAPDAGSIQPHHMLIRFRVAGPLDFTKVRYVIVFNTSGNGAEPYPDVKGTGYANYSFALAVGGNLNLSQPILLQYYLAPGAGLGGHPILIPPQLLNYIPNSGGGTSGGAEFTIDFDRALLAAPAVTTTAPTVRPTTAPQRFWMINFITTDPGGLPLDSMGAFGAKDASFVFPVDTSAPLDQPKPKAQGLPTVSNPSAQLTGVEVINAP